MVELFQTAKQITNGQQKWLFSQLNKKIQNKLTNAVTSLYRGQLRNIVVSRHLQSKLARKATVLNPGVLRDMLESGNFEIIEVNKTNGENRALLRSTSAFEFEGDWLNQCLVISLDSLEIITAYVNVFGDSHRTLRQDIYEKAITFKF